MRDGERCGSYVLIMAAGTGAFVEDVGVGALGCSHSTIESGSARGDI